MANRPVVSPDADLINADWTKQSWDLPPYGSPEFLELVPDLEAFKKTPTYKHAVEKGLIHDDEWVGHHVKPDASPTKTKDRRRRVIHIHVRK